MGHEILKQDPTLSEVVRRLIEAYRPERIYLFGSYARGDVGPDSDYDLLIVVPDSAPPERKRSRLAYEVLRGTGKATDGWSGHGGTLTVVCIWRLRCLRRSFGRGGCCMAEDPVRVSETRSWLDKAANDLRAASHDLKSLPPLIGDTA